MKVTLKDISNDTGFSVSTISRAIRGKGRISEKNRKKILTSARKLGYPLTENADSDSMLHTLSVALITNFRTGEFYSSFFVGFLNAAKKKEINLGLFSVLPDAESVETMLGEVRALGFSAAVIFVPELKEEQYLQILNSKPEDFPILTCSNIDNSVLDTVTFDAYQGATLAVKHFYSQGYRRLGIIEGPYKMPEARFRTNAFSDFIKQTDDAVKTWEFQGDYTLESGIEAFRNFDKQRIKPEAVFAANDSMALGFIETAREAGYKFPDDIAIAGYDNLPFCEYHFPKITSVDTNYTLLADNTLDNLLSRLGKPDKHQGIVSLVPVSLVVRNSSLRPSNVADLVQEPGG